MSGVSKGRYNICVGGTFSPLHLGHVRLLELAFAHAGRVLVGLTSDRMAEMGRDRKVMPFDARRTALVEVLSGLSRTHGVPFEVAEIDDRMGFAVEALIEAIAASEETEATVDEIDLARKRKGLPPLVRFILPMVKDDLGKPISSTRVARGEIDDGGRPLGRKAILTQGGDAL